MEPGIVRFRRRGVREVDTTGHRHLGRREHMSDAVQAVAGLLSLSRPQT
ncbi:hypothetical protein ACFUJ0_24910 [Streptomyces sp. NPDC057242]